MKFTNLIYPASSLALLSLAQPEKVAAQEKPNVLIVIADDCSYYDIGCFGSQNHRTPNIDKLAQEGLKFNNAFNSNSMSAPTRMSLYTGIYSVKHGGYPNGTITHVKPGTKSIPHYLGDLGYRVGLSGKTHIRPDECFPFEEVKGFKKNCNGEDTSYTLDGVTEFIGRSNTQPFCLVVASINPHAPWTGKPRNPNTYNAAQLELPPYWVDTPETREEYMNYLHEVDLLDQEVGDVVQVLKDKNQFDNTLIIFVSEQGTKHAGAKWTVWNPGTKSAMVAYWKGKIAAGRETSALVQYEDITPTLIDLAGGTVPSVIDGKSMKNLLMGNTDEHLDYVFCVHNNLPAGDDGYPIRSVSDGKYKLVWNLTPHKTYSVVANQNAAYYLSWKAVDSDHARFIVNRYENRPEFEFYDVENDIFELTNLVGDAQHAERISNLKNVLKTWMESKGDRGAIMDSPYAPGKPVVQGNFNEDFSSPRWTSALSASSSLPGSIGQNIKIAEEDVNGFAISGHIVYLDADLQGKICLNGGTGHKYAFRLNNVLGSFFEFPIVENAGKITLHARNMNTTNFDDITVEAYDTITFTWKPIKTFRVKANNSYTTLDEELSFNIDSQDPIKLRINRGNRYVQIYKVILEPFSGVPPESEKLGVFDLPTGTTSFEASEVNSHVEMSPLTPRSNLGYDYNTGKGYYRPYNWPTGSLDENTYLEFTITPKNDINVEIDKVRIEHKPNNPNTLGPINTKVAYSTNNKESFTFSEELSFNPDGSNDNLTTSVVNFQNLSSSQPITFRLYAYNSRHGTAAQFDYWIINNVWLYGSAKNATSLFPIQFAGNDLNCYLINGDLYVKNVNGKISVTIYDLLGKPLAKKELTEDGIVSFNFPGNVFVVTFESATGNKSIKVLR